MSCFCREDVEALRQRLHGLRTTLPAPQGHTPEAAAERERTARQAASWLASNTHPPRPWQPQPSAPHLPGTPSASAQMHDEHAVASAASWLTARALPASPWQPGPEWLAAKLPTPRLGREEIATVTLLGTMRKLAESHGIDLLQPNEAIKLNRLVATLNERMTQLAQAGPPPDPGPWLQLAARSEAADAVRKAASAGQLDWTPKQIEAYAAPAGRPMREWLPLLRQVRALSPLIASASQLGVPLDAPQHVTQRIAEAVRALRSLSPPPLAEPVFTAQLTAQLQAFDRLRQSLGIDPAKAGFATVERAVTDRTAAAAAVLKQRPPLPESLPYCPSSVAPPPVLRLAASEGVRKLAELDWKVPPASALPALRSGLPVLSLGGLMAAAGGDPVRRAPCGSGCDAGKLMRALG